MNQPSNGRQVFARRSLRVTLLSIMLTLVLMTVVIVGFVGYNSTVQTAGELSEEILRQTSLHVDSQVDQLIDAARNEAELSAELIKKRVLSLQNFDSIIRYWHGFLNNHAIISDIYFTFESDGTTYLIGRVPPSTEPLVQVLKSGQKGFELFNYAPDCFERRWETSQPAAVAASAGFPAAGLAFQPLEAVVSFGSHFHFSTPVRSIVDLDQRNWLWYQKAKQIQEASWIDTYMFYDEKGIPSYPGVSYSVPIYSDSHELLGVLGIDFNVYTICNLVRTLEEGLRKGVSRNGTIFLLEQRKDGTRQLVGHPNPNQILKKEQQNGTEIASLISIDEIEDPLVRTFLKEIPPSVDPERSSQLSLIAFTHEGKEYLGSYRGLDESEEPAPGWFICVALPKEEIMGHTSEHLTWSVVIGFIVLLTAVLLSLYTSRQVAYPLEELAKETAQMSKFNLEPRPMEHSRILEVDQLIYATEDMKTSLRSFRKYVPADLVAELLSGGVEAKLGGERRTLTISFSDIAGFTSIAETMNPEELVAHLSDYLESQSTIILDHAGTVDKYIGDAVMAFWGAPRPQELHALAACRASLRVQQALAKLQVQWQREGKPIFRARIGINTGEVLVGNVGSAARLNYTVLGDAVNLASRLEGLNKFYGTGILLSETTYQEAKAGIVARPLERVSVKGKSHWVLIYELLGLTGETDSASLHLAERSEVALAAYYRRDWPQAQTFFEEVLTIRPDDQHARSMLQRLDSFHASPPAADWTGIRHMDEK